MKKSCIIFLLSIIIILAAVGGVFGRNAGGSGSNCGEYLRIHIRANSNSEEDQAVKYLVRDKIVEYLTPVVAECHTKSEAVAKISTQINAISAVASSVLRENGYFYGGKASVREEEFPTRIYDELTLPTGLYDALIIELGEGKGDNWWCVVYPPLCFSGGKVTAGNVVYKSKIAEIIEAWKNAK